MAGDDRFRMMFYEEARELLISLEEGLVELERRKDDRAHLDRTFRAAHSIKGAAAMVGLPEIAEFTHGIEAVLERIRAHTLGVDADIITTLLEARDHLAAMVEADANGAPLSAPADLNARLASLLRDPSEKAAPPPSTPRSSTPPPAPDPTPSPAHNPPRSDTKPKARKPRPRAPRKKKEEPSLAPVTMPESGELVHYRIQLKPGPDVLRRGVNPLGVLDELRELGPTEVSTDSELVPPLDELDPERCYLVWRIEVQTTASRDRLDDVFLFMTDDSSVSMEWKGPDGTFGPLPAAQPVLVSASVESIPIVTRESRSAVIVDEEEPVVQAVPSQPPPGGPLPPAPPATGPPAPPTPQPQPHPQHARSVSRIRVDANQLDDLVGLAGELAVLSDNLQSIRDLPGAQPWIHTLEALERVSEQIRDTTLELRMVPVDELFSRFPRVVRDLADRSGKEIELRIIGQDTRLDRTIVERLSDPMIHLIRNGVDHALESPEERVAKGKPRKGRITLTAGHEGDRVAIRVEDDGRGLDRERIVSKGIALGLVPLGTPSDDPRVDSLIFEPGFSTRDKVSELSGRGVGLDVVRDAVRALRGSLAVESMPGKGTAFIFRLPLTLALIDGLLVETGGCRYVVPLAQVEECVALNGSMSALSKGRPCVAVRGELVPMITLRKLFRADGEPPPRQELLLTRHAGQRVGITVDKLVGRVQAVIQALGEGLVGLNRFSGATILGDGTVSLILDLAALVTESRSADHHYSTHSTPPGAPRGEGF